MRRQRLGRGLLQVRERRVNGPWQRRRRFAGAERGSRVFKAVLNRHSDRVRAAKDTQDGGAAPKAAPFPFPQTGRGARRRRSRAPFPSSPEHDYAACRPSKGRLFES